MLIAIVLLFGLDDMLARCTKQQPPGYLELLTILTFQAHQLQTAALAQEDTPCFASANAWKNHTMNCSGGLTKAHCCCCAKLHQRRQPGKCFRKVAAALPCKTLFREGMAASPRSKSLERSLTKAQVRWPTSRPISHINHLPCVARCREQKPSTWVGAAASSWPEHPLMGCTLDLPDVYPSVATFARCLVYPQALVAQGHHHAPASSLARDIVLVAPCRHASTVLNICFLSGASRKP